MISPVDPYSTLDALPVVAATIGIAASRWGKLPAETPEEDARTFMLEHRFDVVPLVNSETCVAYAATREWGNWTVIEVKPIEEAPRLGEDVPFPDIVADLTEHGPPYRFLQRTDGAITGLLTVSHLNLREARVWLFHRLSAFELALEAVIRAARKEQLISDEILARYVKPEAVGAWYQDTIENDDNDLVSYCYLSDFINVMHKANLYEFAGLWRGSKQRSSEWVSVLIGRRNAACHPSRPLVASPDRIPALLRDLRILNEALEALHARGFHS